MRWLIAGTAPELDFPLVDGAYRLRDGELFFPGRDLRLPVNRGTPALAAAAALACASLDIPPPALLMAGDEGKGRGSRLVYARLLELLPDLAGSGLTFHYLLPDLDWHSRILAGLEGLNPRPFLVADAGYMYVAKMSGYAASYDLFTPDIGELAFLADEKAPHPFYTRGFLLEDEENAPALAERAFKAENSAKTLLVKGRNDYLVQNGRVLARVEEPMVEAMEAVGGTGDTLTGLATAFLAAGRDTLSACLSACRVNRWMGALAGPDPSTQIMDILRHLPEAMLRASE